MAHRQAKTLKGVKMYGEVKIYLATILEVQKSSVKVRYNNTTSDFVPYT
ncbi:hypothetical protein NHP20013_09470 [Helicobacter bizzozeronii]|nr:hypothetical protein NHP20013_09470 [Helicobacter bizzozeronii]